MTSGTAWQQRPWTYVVVAVSLAATCVGLQWAEWHGSAELHTITKVIATMLALTVGLVAIYMMEGSERARQAAEEARRNLAVQAKQLQRSNKDLEQFAYVASHDLKEPLRMVAGYLQLLAGQYAGKLDGEADKFIACAVDGATRMQKMIDDILQYSRVGCENDSFEPVDLNEVVANVRYNLDMAIRSTGARITVDPLPIVRANPTLLEQLLQNLVANCLKFCGEVPPQVAICCARRGNDWQITVRDNGIGIDPRHYERVFGIFQRLHSRSKYEGNGIGLAVCKKIVERHDGEIWVESQVGLGTAIHFTLPQVEIEEPAGREAVLAG